MNKYVFKNTAIFITLLTGIAFLFSSCSGCSQTSIHKNSGNNSDKSSIENNNSIKQDIKSQNKTAIPEREPDENTIIQEQPHSTPKLNKDKRTVSQMFKHLQNGVFMVFAYDDVDEGGAQGSGFFINSSGIGITNYHVLEGFKEHVIKTSDGKFYKIKKILESSKPEDKDYMIFQVENKGSSFVSLAISKNTPAVGDDVFAIGSPKGLENSLTKGSVSQFRSNSRIQIDATIEHGSSGGPLFDMNGEVIGITTSKLKDTDAALNFAIDIQSLPYEQYTNKNRRHKKQSLIISHTSTTGQIINHKYFTVSYREEDEQAEWVSYKITDQNINNAIERTNDYRHDPTVSTRSADLYDYKGSGYDMGHLAPARTMSHNDVAMSESFYLSNISPQVPSFNRGIWKRLEQKVRYWSFFNDSTFVVTGPILKNSIKKIGYNNVTVPKAFYKTLVGFKDGKVKGIAFIIPNQYSNKSIYSYITSIDYVEEITGIDFYYNLNKQIQNKIEINGDLKKWSLK